MTVTPDFLSTCVRGISTNSSQFRDKFSKFGNKRRNRSRISFKIIFISRRMVIRAGFIVDIMIGRQASMQSIVSVGLSFAKPYFQVRISETFKSHIFCVLDACNPYLGSSSSMNCKFQNSRNQFLSISSALLFLY